MLTKTALITAFAAAALADSGARPVHLMAKRYLEARQTDVDFNDIPGLSEATACITAVADLITSIPTPPPELLSITDVPTGDLCTYTPPASIAEAYSSYSSVFMAWSSSHDSNIRSALAECPDASSYIEAIDVCSTTKSDGTQTTPPDANTTAAPSGSGGAGAAPTDGASGAGGSGNGSGSGSGAGSKTSTAGAARETGLVGAAIAAAGFLGVVAAL